MKLKMRTAWAMPLILGLALSGCAQQSLHIPGGSEPATWVEIPGDVPIELFEVGSGFTVTDTETEVFLSGSGSCPPVIDSAAVSYDGDHNSLVINLEKYPKDTPCTDDLGFYGFQFKVPVSSVTVSDPNTGLELQVPQMD